MIVCFDLETTGLDNSVDRIIEISMVKFDEKTFEVVDSFDTFVNPEMDIPEVISNITNIFQSDVEWAPRIEDLRDKIEAFIWDTPVLWHNVHFDRDFYLSNGINIKNNIYLDTFFLANFLSFKSASLNLEVLCKYYNAEFSGAHRAINDVKATISLFWALLKDFSKLSALKKELAFYLFDKSNDKNVEYLKEIIFSESTQSIQEDAFEKKVLKKLKKFKSDIKPNKSEIKIKDVNDLYKKIENIEKRENQEKMTQLVYETFQKEKKVVIEAPTGLWKSFAYIIPAICHSLKTGEKVYVSTKTKNLQDQLYTKDLSYLHEKLGYDFSYAKLKWKSNYLSIKSYFEDVFSTGHTYNKTCFLLKLTLWLFETEHWELDELNFYGQEYTFLKLLNADVLGILWDKNQYSHYEFLYKARKQVEISDIVVINHSLLFSDLENENKNLPELENLVIDEAHNIEDSITDSLKKRYNYQTLCEHLDLVENIFTAKKIKKIKFLQSKEQLLARLDVLEEYGNTYLNRYAPSWQAYINILLKQDFFDDIDFSELAKKLEESILDMLDILSSFPEYDFQKEKSFIEYVANVIKNVLDKSDVQWSIKILNFNSRQWLSFETTLLNPWKYLETELWWGIKSVILTSATLQINNSYDYITKLLYLEKFDFHTFESDFDYSKQSTLFLPTDLWNIKSNSSQVSEFLKQFYLAVRWKTLTLLTSFSMIKNIYTHSNIALRDAGINLYAQSFAGSKMKLIQFYLDDSKNSILLGTNSFWEWVDIPGDNLKYLVIHKFPFSVPTDPIFQARSAFFDDAFRDYSIPKAIIKLKQGFGRLIRTKTDTGVVILLDSRINAPNWWKDFFDAFPKDINIKKWKSETFLDILRDR